MDCTSCNLEITSKHDTLECFGACGHKFHFSCLNGANKSYKKSLISTLNDIQNLLWFCDECLPNIIAAFSPRDEQSNIQPNSTQNNNIDSQQMLTTFNISQQSNTLAALVSNHPTNSVLPS